MFLITARRVLLGITLGVLLALIVAPQTRWIVNVQTAAILHRDPLGSPSSEAATTAQVRKIAARYPNDYQLQYSAALWTGDLPAVQTLRALEARFPSNPSLRANILRYACINVHWNFPNQNLVQSAPPTQRQSAVSQTDIAAFDQDAFDQDAAAGERLAPGNIYFPLMRAAGLYAAHKDAAAQAEILRAAKGTFWNDYATDDVEGRWRLSALVFGDGAAQDAIARSAVSSSLLLPDSVSIREVARMAAMEAMAAECKGDFARGIALRQAMIHCGGLIRSQSVTLIGSIVAMGVVDTAMARPGGTPLVKTDNLFAEHPALLNAYLDFLRQHGAASDAAPVAAEYQANQATGTTIMAGMESTYPLMAALERIQPWWMAGLITLTNALWLVILAACSLLIQRRQPPRVPFAVAAFVLACIAAGAAAWWAADAARNSLTVSFSGTEAEDAPIFLQLLVTFLCTVAPLLLLTLSFAFRRRLPFGRALVAFSVPAACLLLLGYTISVVGTAQRERAANTILIQSLRGWK